MTQAEFENIWNYFLSLDDDLASTSQYVEPTQPNVYSFEFLKIIILSCSEVETTLKYMCKEIEENKKIKGDIGEYKRIILGKYPDITRASVRIDRIHKKIMPFENWDKEKLFWWESYQNIKHDRGKMFEKATYWNAVHALAALYILIFYLSNIMQFEFYDCESKYLHSDYSHQLFACAPPKKLPDFES